MTCTVGLPCAAQVDDILLQLDSFRSDRHTISSVSRAIRKAQKKLIKINSTDGLRILDALVDSVDQYQGASPTMLRVIYLHHASAWRKVTGYQPNTEKYLLKAHHAIPLSSLLQDKNLWLVENRLGIFNNIWSDHDRSMYYYQLVIDGFRFRNSPVLCRALSNMARLKITMNDADGAVDLAKEGIVEARKFNNISSEFTNRTHLLDGYILQEKFDAAQTQLDTILLLYRADSTMTSQKRIYELQAHLAESKQQFDRAFDFYGKAISSCQQDDGCDDDRYQAKRFYHLGNVALTLGKLAECQQAIDHGFTILLNDKKPLYIANDSLKLENTFVQMYNLLAKYQLEKFANSGSKKELDTCRLALDRAFNMFERIVADVPNEQAKYIIAHNNKSIANTSIELCYARQELDEPLSDDEITSYIEKSGSQIFNQLLAERQALSILSNNEKVRVDKINKRLAAIRVGGNASAEDLGSTLQLSAMRDSLLRKNHIDLPKINGPFIYFFVGDHFVYSINSFAGHFTIQKVGPTDHVLIAVRRFLTIVLNEGPLDSVMAEGHEVFSLLFDGMANIPDAFSVIGEGILNQLPFDALVDNSGRYLVESYQIDYRLSQRYVRQRFTPEPIDLVSPSYASSSDLIPLRFSHMETDKISSTYSSVNTSPALTATHVDSALRYKGIFHFTGHAQSADFQGKLLAAQRMNDLYGRAISSTPSSKSLSILSACETGIGEMKYGEGTMSLARAFLSGGTGHVINSLWAVNEQSTAMLIQYLYGELKKKKVPAQALRQAKLTYLEESTKEAKHPYYWAGFICTSAAVTESSFSATWYYGVACVALLITFFWFRKRKSTL